MTKNVTIEKKPMRLAAYLGLYFVAWIAGSVITFNISGNTYAGATVPVIIGFWLSKIALRNKRRDWSGIIAFPIINFISGLLGFSLGYALSRTPESVNFSALISLVIAFVFSCGFFALFSNQSRHNIQEG
jgi:hypothetical protein